MEQEMLHTEDRVSELVHQYSDMVLRLAVSYLKNMSDAEDVCQNVFIKLFSRVQEFHDPEHEKAWILRVTINACKDVLRSPWKRRFLPFHNTALPIKEKQNKEVVTLVLGLPAKYCIVVHLFYFENYSSGEIAKLLNKKEATVRTQLKRPRELLKAKMAGGFDDE